MKCLAAHLDIEITKLVNTYLNEEPVPHLKRKFDPVLLETCIFFDTEHRRCSVYEARPGVCREWPKLQHQTPGAEGRCSYFDLYKFAQNEQGLKVVPLVQLTRCASDKQRKAIGE